MNLIKDKYILLALAVMLVTGLVCITEEDVNVQDDIVGIASDVKRTEKGNTFLFTDAYGTTMKCYYSGNVSNGAVYSIKGSFSDDGNIFFISGMTAR